MRNTLSKASAFAKATRLLPLAAFVLLSALTVRFIEIPVSGESQAVWPEPTDFDCLSWWKAALATGSALWMAVLVLPRLAGGWRPGGRRFGILLSAAAVGVLVSALGSNYPLTAWFGFVNRYEGAFVLFAYLFAMWYTSVAVERRLDAVRLARVMGLVGIVNAVIGVFQRLGMDFWMTAPGVFLLRGGDMKLSFNFSAARVSYGTVYQPNNYGMLMAMLAALSLGMILAEAGRGWMWFWLAAAAVSLFALVFSQSLAGMAAYAGTMLLWLCIAAWRCKRGSVSPEDLAEIRRAALPAAAALAAAVLLGFWFSWRFAGLDETAGISYAKLRNELSGRRRHSLLHEVELRENRLRIKTEEGEATLIPTETDAWLVSGVLPSGGPARLRVQELENGEIEYAFADMPSFKATRRPGGQTSIQCGEIMAAASSGGVAYVRDSIGRWTDSLRGVRALGFAGRSRSLSGRGYIWSRALGMLADNPWFGTGPDTFGQVFPNGEISGDRILFEGKVIDKGHNLVIHNLLCLGVIGCLLWGVAIIHAFWHAVWKNDFLLLAAAMAMLAYLVGGIAVDSTTGVTPIFAALTGLAACSGLSRQRTIADK